MVGLRDVHVLCPNALSHDYLTRTRPGEAGARPAQNIGMRGTHVLSGSRTHQRQLASSGSGTTNVRLKSHLRPDGGLEAAALTFGTCPAHAG